MINVTKPFLPPREEFDKYIDGIWLRNWLTNNGPLVNDLELKLKEYLSVNHLLYVSNGTIALQIAIKALDLKGDIITTPFSYIATTSSIIWEGCKPVFVDIDQHSFNIDPSKIESAITPKTSAILATHVFGNPCDVEAIGKIARKHSLKIIYDGAHAFAVKYSGKSIFDFGDISTCSFHATKLYHTVEGGAVFTTNAEVLQKMAYLRNFGHNGPYDFFGLGINGKNSEFHAAFGLVNLNHIEEILTKRKYLSQYYDEKLKTFRFQKQKISPHSLYNYSYYPVVLESEEMLLNVEEQLNLHWIYPRRYFYPSLNTVPYSKGQPAPISESISRRVLCLPLYHELAEAEIDMISRILLRVQNN